MKATIETIAMIRQADQSAIDAAKSGVGAVMALIRENINEKFPHGAAVELASILKDGKVSPASAKRYAELCVMACKAIAHQATLAASKAKQVDKTSTKEASMAASLTELSGMASMAKVRDWSKVKGPKAKTDDKTDNKTDNKTDDKTDIIQGAPVANDPDQEKAMALEGYRIALSVALKAGISPDTLKALILAEGKAKVKAKVLSKAG